MSLALVGVIGSLLVGLLVLYSLFLGNKNKARIDTAAQRLSALEARLDRLARQAHAPLWELEPSGGATSIVHGHALQNHFVLRNRGGAAVAPAISFAARGETQPVRFTLRVQQNPVLNSHTVRVRVVWQRGSPFDGVVTLTCKDMLGHEHEQQLAVQTEEHGDVGVLHVNMP